MLHFLADKRKRWERQPRSQERFPWGIIWFFPVLYIRSIEFPMGRNYLWSIWHNAWYQEVLSKYMLIGGVDWWLGGSEFHLPQEPSFITRPFLEPPLASWEEAGQGPDSWGPVLTACPLSCPGEEWVSKGCAPHLPSFHALTYLQRVLRVSASFFPCVPADLNSIQLKHHPHSLPLPLLHQTP